MVQMKVGTLFGRQQATIAMLSDVLWQLINYKSVNKLIKLI